MGVHVFPILNTPPTSLPIPPLWVIPVHQPQASCILHLTWTGDSFLIWYYTCFNAILPNHHTPPNRVQKTVLNSCVSFSVSHTGLSLPSFKIPYICVWLDGCESGWTPGIGDGQGGLACCDSWGRKESDTTERLNWTDTLFQFWFLRCVCPAVGLLGHMAVLFPVF